MVEKIFDISSDLLKNYKWEIFIEEKTVLTASSKDMKIDKLRKAKDTGFSVRVEKNGHVGFAYGTVLSEKDIKNIIEKALALSEISDEKNLLLQKPLKAEKVEYFDTFAAKELPDEDKIYKAIEIEETAYKIDHRIKGVRDANFSETILEKHLLNSEGVKLSQKGTIYSAQLGVLAEDKGDSQISWNYTASRFFGELGIEEIVKEAVLNAVSLLGATPIKTQELPVLFPPYAMTEILAQFFPMFSGESLIKGKTPFSQLKNKNIFPDKLTIIDNGLLKKGIGTFSYDDEGTPSQETVIIGNGKFINFLHNLYTASLSGEKSTGNGKRNFKTSPYVAPTNLYIDKTSINVQKELSYETYFKVIELIGLHTANVITGDFSVGATGILYVKGEPVQSVKEVTLAGNFIQMLKDVEIIGNDLKFYGNIGSPSVFVKGLMIGGY